MELISDYVDPVTLTGYARTALADLPANQFALATWLPDETIDDIDFRINRGQGGLSSTAKFRSYDTESPVTGRRGVQRIMGELPPISEKKVLGEYARLRMRRLDTNDPLLNEIYNDVATLVRSIAARLELARGEVLVTGQLVINENEVVQTVDFGRTPSMSGAPSNLWSSGSATIVADLMAWLEAYVAVNGVEPGAMQVSRRILATMLRAPEFRALVATTAGTPSIVNRASLDALLSSYGLPPLRTYDVQMSVDGVARRVIPDDRLLMLPGENDGSNKLGATFWGTTLEAQEPEYAALGGAQAGIVAGNMKSKDPIMVWTHASAIGLPVLANPDRAMVMDVL